MIASPSVSIMAHAFFDVLVSFGPHLLQAKLPCCKVLPGKLDEVPLWRALCLT